MRNPDDQAIPIVVNIIAIVNIIVIANIIAFVVILIIVIVIVLIVVIVMISANPCPISENLAEFHAVNQSKFIITVR